MATWEVLKIRWTIILWAKTMGPCIILFTHWSHTYGLQFFNLPIATLLTWGLCVFLDLGLIQSDENGPGVMAFLCMA